MARIGDVWDSTTDVLAGRAGPIAWIAALGVFLPNVLGNAVKIFGGGTPGMAGLAGLIGLAGLLASLWAGLAIIAIASDPATTRGEAGRLALRRLPRNLLVVVVMVGVVLLLAIPPIAALAASGFDWQAMAAAQNGGGTMPTVAPGAGAFVSLYALVVLAVLLWVSARLFLVNAVVLNEGKALGALRRSWALTAGLRARLIGVALLFGVVLIVTATAAGVVVGLVVRLLAGPGGVAASLFGAALANAGVQAAFVAVVQVFAARLYAAVAPTPARPAVEGARTGPWG